MTAPSERQASRRAQARLVAVGLALVSVVVVGVALIVAHHRTEPRVASVAPANPSKGDVAAERVLATRPMTWLPAVAAQPHPLTTSTAGSPVVLPSPSTQDHEWVPKSFPRSAEGALAQLVVLDETGAAGGDPDSYARAYAEIADAGAPPVAESALHTVLSHFRQAAGIAAGEVKPGLSVRFDVTQGLIKGTADGGSYVVACVLGELSTDAHGYGANLGIGDCQALRWTASGWRVSDGPRAAYAPCAWPGSAEAIAAGYRTLVRSDR
ncbi:hypothetical protein AB0878_45005 [Amycolatopsis sp. NPDC047767]|uniref:hypothetical protein n=1 Tax=Amycolatopsis sp. NPDC047767 TaxID=3156765 RepID=UPI0034523364